MTRRKAEAIPLSDDQKAELESLVRAHTTPQQLALRARIVLLAGEGLGVTAAAEQLGIWRKTVSNWRQRWLARAPGESIAKRLADEPRPGGPPVFTPEQICSIIALACERPEEGGLPITHWSQSALARQAKERGLVESISQRSVGRFLKRIGASAAPGSDVAHPQARS